jgi:hypothetical protein
VKFKLSPAIFVASILCFLLPFITVSCGGQKIGSFSGLQLATGTTVDQPQMFGPAQKENVDAEPMATIAGLCALVGLGVSFLTKMQLAPAITGAIGATSLFLMKTRLDEKIVKQGQGMLQVNYEVGYSLAVLLLIAGAAWNAYLYIQGRKPAAPGAPVLASTPTAPPLQAGPPALQVWCPACGTSTRPGKFCGACGKPMSTAS